MTVSEDEYSDSLLNELESRLNSGNTIGVPGWFQVVEEIARRFGLLWVVAEPPAKGHLLGSIDNVDIINDSLKAEAFNEVIRRIAIDPPVGQTHGVLESRLRNAGVRLWFGVDSQGATEEPSCNLRHETFVERLADIADAALTKLEPFHGGEIPQSVSMQDSAAIAVTAAAVTTGLFLHDMVNTARSLATGISVLAEAQDSGELKCNENHSRLLKMMEKSAEQLLATLRDMTHLLRPDARRPCSLREVVEQSIQLHDLRLASRSITPVIDVSPESLIDVPFHVASLALDNLISNAVDAIASSGKGGHISIRAEEGEGAIYCRVTDDGPGIKDEIRGRLFNEVLKSSKNSTGFGLYLVARLLRAHMGDIYLAGTSPHETTFTVRFPAAGQEQRV